MAETAVPQHILIVGAGVFGLSTALSLLGDPTYQSSKITIVDGSPSLPNPSGSSVDANRIVRADYAYKHYARLALEAQVLWRDQTTEGWGGEGRYHEPGFVLTSDGNKDGYLRESLATIRSLAVEAVESNKKWVDANKIKPLAGRDEIRNATGYEHVSGDHGYANFNSGWADAEACVAYALKRLQTCERVTIRSGAQVERLLFSMDTCNGVVLAGDEQIHAHLVVLAAGAWSPSLVDLQGRCLATGQTLAFVDISPEEEAAMAHRPTIMNMSRGMFIIPPRGGQLKVARHGYGYRNLVKIPRRKINPLISKEDVGDDAVQVSVPEVGIPVPFEGQEAIREAMRELVPEMADRPFTRTRICWYCDTPTGDFLITYHPQYRKTLFVATGGSGHGFKFFPVIGDKIVDAIQDRLDPELATEWRWRSEDELEKLVGSQGFIACDDGSRAGRKGMLLDEEMAKGRQ